MLEVVEEIFSGGIFFACRAFQKQQLLLPPTTIHIQLSVGDVSISPHAPNTKKGIHVQVSGTIPVLLHCFFRARDR